MEESFQPSIPCNINLFNSSSITCSIGDIPAGSYDLVVLVSGVGIASGENGVTSLLQVTDISPSGGSIHGGTTLVITGTGFAVNATSVDIDGSACDVISATGSQIQCTTGPHAAGSFDISITVYGTTESFPSYNYNETLTPLITSVRYI